MQTERFVMLCDNSFLILVCFWCVTS